MDLPTCPACGQSVIDDDATECPFCGASMSGGAPAKRPAAPAAAGGASASAKGKSSKLSSSTKTDTAASDEITADTESARNAVPVSPRQTKVRKMLVVCPMCETEGYIPERVAGRDVKCANPECLVPVFTAPEKEPEPEPEPEPKSILTPGVLTIVGILVIGVGAGSVWFTMQQSNQKMALGPSAMPQVVKRDLPTFDPPAVDAPSSEDPATGDPVTPTPSKTVTLETVREETFRRMIQTSLQGDRNRSKAFCRQMTAVALADAGRIDEAREQLENLRKVGGQVPFYEIAPLVAIGWQQLAGGDAAAAGTSAATASALADSLPRVGRASIDDATALASLLAGLGERDAARDLVTRFATPSSLGVQSAVYQIAKARGTFDVASVGSGRPILGWTNPQMVAVTRSLTARGFSDQALAWAQALSDEAVRAECLSGWAIERSVQSGSVADVAEVAKSLSPAGRLMLWARLARLTREAGRTDDASQAMALAVEAAGALPPPEALKMPADLRGVVDVRIPERNEGRATAAALIELAAAQATSGDADAAWNSVVQAVEAARAVGPNPQTVGQAVADFESAGSVGFRQKIKAELDLRSDDEARRKSNDYRKKLFELRDASARRYALQVELLQAATDWAVRDRLWDYVVARSQGNGDEPAEPFLETVIPSVLMNRYAAAGNEERLTQLKNSVTRPRTDAREELRESVRKAMTAADWKSVEDSLQQFRADTAWRDLWATEVACRLVAEGKIDDALTFVSRIPFPLVREDAYEFVAAQAAASGKWQPIWQRSQQDFGQATEQIAFCRGLISGLAEMKSGAAEVAVSE